MLEQQLAHERFISTKRTSTFNAKTMQVYSEKVSSIIQQCIVDYLPASSSSMIWSEKIEYYWYKSSVSIVFSSNLRHIVC